jgi:hypothetical protein
MLIRSSHFIQLFSSLSNSAAAFLNAADLCCKLSINEKVPACFIDPFFGHQTNGTSLAAIKAAWTEAKLATHFISIQPDYYVPYLQQFGKLTEVEAIIRQFIQ